MWFATFNSFFLALNLYLAYVYKYSKYFWGTKFMFTWSDEKYTLLPFIGKYENRYLKKINIRAQRHMSIYCFTNV